MRVLHVVWKPVLAVWSVITFLWYMLQSISRWYKWTFLANQYPLGPRGPWAVINTVRAFISPKFAAHYYQNLVDTYGTVVMTPAPFWQFVVIVAEAEAHGFINENWRLFPRGWIQSLFASFIGDLIGSEGEKQRYVRMLVNPYLNMKAVKSYIPTVQEEILRLFAKWKEQSSTGISTTNDLVDLFAGLSAKFLVGGYELRPGLGAEIVQLISLFQSNPVGKKFRKAKRKIFAEIRQLLNLAKNHEMGIISAFADEVKKGTMTVDDVIPEIIGLLAASVETTANLAASLTYELSRDHTRLEKLRTEALYVLNGKSEFSTDDVERLSYAFLCTDEAARLWPAAWRSQRAASIAHLKLIGTRHGKKKEYELPKWAQVFSLVNLIHTDRKIWGADALIFNPEKNVTKDALKSKPKGAYAPWLFGPHMCPGMPLSRYETALFAAWFAITFENPYYEHEHKPVLGATTEFPRNAKLKIAA